MTTLRPISEREIKPKEPTTLTVEILDLKDPTQVAQTYHTRLHSVRDGFAFAEDGHPYCLDEGYLYCDHEGGIRLDKESLALCKALLGKE
jgi:hypothetical protein